MAVAGKYWGFRAVCRRIGRDRRLTSVQLFDGLVSIIVTGVGTVLVVAAAVLVGGIVVVSRRRARPQAAIDAARRRAASIAACGRARRRETTTIPPTSTAAATTSTVPTPVTMIDTRPSKSCTLVSLRSRPIRRQTARNPQYFPATAIG